MSVNLIDLEKDTTVTISGKNQTLINTDLGTDTNSNQDFGTITIAGSKSTTLDVTLDNTARVDGVLTVAGLLVNDNTATDLSAVTTLNLHSTGARATSNVVRDLDAARVTTLNLSGTQALGVDVSNLATLPSSTTAPFTPPLTIDGTGLVNTVVPANLTLAVNADILDNDNHDVITANAANTNLLALYGTLSAADTYPSPTSDFFAVDPTTGQDVPNQPQDSLTTTVSGFQTLQFGWLDQDNTTLGNMFGHSASVIGTFNLTNTTGANNFVIGNIQNGGNPGMLNLLNIHDGSHVAFGDATGDSNDSQFLNNVVGNTFVFQGSGTLNIDSVKQLAWQNFVQGASYVVDEGFSTINWNIQRDDNSSNSLHQSFFTDNAAHTLNITGANATGTATDGNLGLTVDTALNTALTTIDVSGFKGNLDLGTWNSNVGTHSTIVVNTLGDFTFDLLAGNTYGDAQSFVNTQLGTDANYGAGSISANLTGTILGDTGLNTTITIPTILGETKDQALTALATSINNLVSTPVHLGPAAPDGVDYFTHWTANYVAGGNLTVTETVTDSSAGGGHVLRADQAFTTDFSLTSTGGTGLALNENDAVSNFGTTFKFLADAKSTADDWTIDHFNAFYSEDPMVSLTSTTTANNISVLDLSALGVHQLTDLTLDDTTVAGETIITETGHNFEIILSGVASAHQLTAQNFAFA